MVIVRPLGTIFGPVGGKVGLIDFRDVLVTVRGNVAALKKQGQTLEEVLAAEPTSNYDAKWGDFVIDGKTFTSLVYAWRLTSSIFMDRRFNVITE
jgi:hypothetical protein